MEQAMGWLGWSPDQFWSATMTEVVRAICGYVEARTGKNPRAKAEFAAQMLKEVREAE